MKKSFQILFIVLITFSMYFFAQKFLIGKLIHAFYVMIPNNSLAYLISYIIIGIPTFIAVIYLNKASDFFKNLGLQANFLQALYFALFCTLPMIIGYALIFKFNTEINAREIIMGAVGAAFFEELYFRGFLFGQIYRFSRFGFIYSLIIPSFIFASLHLYQGTGLLLLSGIFITTLLGSAMFAWLYIEWNNNLWVPILLHFLMNLYWMLFSAGENALGGLQANIFRVTTIILIISGTLVYKRKMGLKLAINRTNVWLK